MKNSTNKITVKSIKFSHPPFRKLSRLSIDLADRLTLITGHNGIGKSTILGLLSNTFGITDSSVRSYFGEPFYANIERIIYLALSEVDKAKDNPSSAPIVTADVYGQIVQKRCALTKRNKYQRARVVPRTYDDEEIEEEADELSEIPDHSQIVGPDAKIPLPTIYLGIRRLASIGEAEEKEVSIDALEMHEEDRKLMKSFVGEIIIGSGVTSEVTSQSIKGSRKRTAQPGYARHDPQSVSMGQDSLASIATALASFNYLKREMGEDYSGGLLVIDELDVGFHPHAIGRLVQQLKTHARKLSLQIVATSHSPMLIEAVHPEGPEGHVNSPDKVIYLLDTAHPRMAEDQSLRAILDDMAQRIDVEPKKKAKPILGIYFEDEEAVQFCEELIPAIARSRIASKYGITLRLIGLGVGGSSLLGFPSKDPIFADRVLIVDGDTTISRVAAARGNVAKLPCVTGSSGTARSPENTIKAFIQKMITDADGVYHGAMLNLTLKNPSTDKLFTQFFDGHATESEDRNSSKKWWEDKFSALRNWGVIKQWAIIYPNETEAFRKSFEQAVETVSKRLHSKAGQAT
ncbi:AAA family ATPase [Acidovorax sp. FG27]|uniref:AAA family ATPase n=1 Tax=Acidovorax sp. FG27 TaxID=3133652 RepID=UPI0030E77EDA